MTQALLSLSTSEFISSIEAVAAKFDSATFPPENLPADDWALLVGNGVLLPALPKEYGGRDSHVEMCQVIETLSEWNLPLGVYATVNMALGLRPIVMWAGEQAKQEVLPLFSGGDPMGAGFAATEPGCGSAMSSMTTTFEGVDEGYRIRGRKHWQALSFSANWWVVAAKNANGKGSEYGFFIVKRSEGFRTVERYEPLGLKAVDYGVNDIDAVVPPHRRIRAEKRDLGTMVEILLASRSMMAAMGCGFLRRVSREAHAYAESRQIGPAPLSAIRFARYRLAAIDSSYTICEALSHHLRTRIDLKADMMSSFPAVQAIKTVATERILSAALHYQQLAGGEGYRCGSPTNIAGQAALDARVFPIFDGNNDLLSEQLTGYCLARMAGRTLSGFLSDWPLTAPGVTAYEGDLSFLDRALEQEHMVLAGRAIAYLFAITQVLTWATETEADADRVRVATEFLKTDVIGVETEFNLLATDILGIDDEVAGPSDGAAPSRSIPAAAGR